MSETKVVTGKVRFSYEHVFKAHSMSEADKKKYSVSIIIPKKDKKTLDKVEAAINIALKNGITKFGGKIPKKWKNPLRDGDEEREDDGAYQGCFFINASSSIKPFVVDQEGRAIEEEDGEFYSGCYGRASVNFYAFNVSGNSGVACGLNGVKKTEDGERLGGNTSSAKDFDDDEDDLD